MKWERKAIQSLWVFKYKYWKVLTGLLKALSKSINTRHFPTVCPHGSELTWDTELAPSLNVSMLLRPAALRWYHSLPRARSSHQSGLTLTVTVSTVRSVPLTPCSQHRLSCTEHITLLLDLPWGIQAHSVNLCQPLQLLKQNAPLPV